jgi:hypothetical protein
MSLNLTGDLSRSISYKTLRPPSEPAFHCPACDKLLNNASTRMLELSSLSSPQDVDASGPCSRAPCAPYLSNDPQSSLRLLVKSVKDARSERFDQSLGAACSTSFSPPQSLRRRIFQYGHISHRRFCVLFGFQGPMGTKKCLEPESDHSPISGMI